MFMTHVGCFSSKSTVTTWIVSYLLVYTWHTPLHYPHAANAGCVLADVAPVIMPTGWIRDPCHPLTHSPNLVKICAVFHISKVSCHAYAWQIGPFLQDTIDIMTILSGLQNTYTMSTNSLQHVQTWDMIGGWSQNKGIMSLSNTWIMSS